MKKSYDMQQLVNSFPDIGLPLNSEQLAKTRQLGDLQMAQRFVEKSARIQVLDAERQKAAELSEKAVGVYNSWFGKGGPKAVSLKLYDYGYADRGWKQMVVQRLDKAKKEETDFVEKEVRLVLSNMFQFFGVAYEELTRAAEIEQKGIAGEELVENFLVRNLDCRILTGVILPSAQQSDNAPRTAETDMLVFADNGIYVCEIKNYGKAGQTLEVQPDGHIVKLGYTGQVLDDMGSPFAQNYWHCRAVDKILSDAGIRNIPIYSAVIIANTDVEIVNYSDQWIGDMYSFRDHICSCTSTITAAQLQSAFGAVQKYRLGERKFPIPTISHMVADIENTLDVLQQAADGYSDWESEAQAKVSEWQKTNYEQWRAASKVWCRYYNRLQRMSSGATVGGALYVLFFILLVISLMGENVWWAGLGSGFFVAMYWFCLLSCVAFVFMGIHWFKDFCCQREWDDSPGFMLLFHTLLVIACFIGPLLYAILII